MNMLIGAVAAIVGYLIGSISFTRIVLALRAPGAEIEQIKQSLPDSPETFTSTSISASTVMHQLGPKWGGITMLLDMLKALIPAVVFHLLFPDQYYNLIAALFVMVGHNYPLYYHFKGGRGLAAMMGGFLAFDILGTLATAVLGIGIGILSGQVVLIRWSGMILMIFWAMIFHPGWQPTVYVLLANAIFWFAMRKEVKRFLELRKENIITDQKIVAEFMGMGSMYGLIERFSIPALLKKPGKEK
jgi:glycerol-3-phosphate acyltransferase PlsY